MNTKRILLISLLTLIPLTLTNKNVSKVNALTHEGIRNCSSTEINTIGNFSINTIINSIDKLNFYKTERKTPANAIFTIDKDLNILDSSNKSIGVSLDEAVNSYFNPNIIPCVYIKDIETKNSFVNYWNNSWKQIDIAIVSDDSSLLLEARKELPNIRDILDYSNKELVNADFSDVIGEINTCRANTLIINKSIANKYTFDYFQARFKSVWVNDLKSTNIELLSHVTSGAYGIIVEDYLKSIDTLKVLNSTLYPERNYNRSAFLIAQRGACKTTYENSIESYLKAYENGATHIEIDLRLTKDNKFVAMNDETLDRTTNGTGKVSDFTADELKSYKITKNFDGDGIGKGVSIPTLDEIFNEFKNKDVVLVLDIKTEDENAIKILKNYIDEANNSSQIVVFTSLKKQIEKMLDILPNIPVANVNNLTGNYYSETSLETLNNYNCIPELSFGAAGGQNSTQETFKFLSDRGFPIFQHNFDTLANTYNGIRCGITGIVTNSADSVALTCPNKLDISSNLTVKSLANYSLTTYALNYNGKKINKKLTATPLLIEEDGKTSKVIFQARFSTGDDMPKVDVTLFSEIITVKIGTPISSILIPGGIALVVIIGAVTILLIIKKKNSKQQKSSV